MSVGRMLTSGVLVAGGLVLGTFTLHGYLDPNWAQTQLAAAAAHSKPAAVAQATTAEQFPSRSRFVASETGADRRPTVVKASSKSAASPAAARQPETKTAASTPTAKPAIRKKVADKPKQPPAPPAQQASLQFPWNWKLFGN